jgi:hypothetical protein
MCFYKLPLQHRTTTPDDRDFALDIWAQLNIVTTPSLFQDDARSCVLEHRPSLSLGHMSWYRFAGVG